MLELGLKVLISYLIGSLNGSLIIGRFSGVDIRKVGSGNAGGTNALRTQGFWFAFCVMVIDIGKGFLPVFLLPVFLLPGVPFDPGVSRVWLTLACGAAAIVGHCYPVWFQFAGGKGMATSLGVLMAIAPGLLLLLAIVFTVVLTVTGYVGLASMSAMISLPIYLGLMALAENTAAFLFLLLLAVFIVFTHRSNLQRMSDGSEEKMESVMLKRFFR